MANSYSTIGDLYKAKDDYDRALEFYQKGLNINLKIYGEEHQQVADCYGKIGDLYKVRGEHTQARDYWDRAIAIYEGLGNEAKVQKLRKQIANLESE